jgi:hypothetical protein
MSLKGSAFSGSLITRDERLRDHEPRENSSLSRIIRKGHSGLSNNERSLAWSNPRRDTAFVAVVELKSFTSRGCRGGRYSSSVD